MIWFKKIYFRIFGLILIVLMHKLGFAQMAPLKLTVVDNKNQAIAFANISIQMVDSTMPKNQVADSNGIANIILQPGKLYTLKTSAVGYQIDNRTIKFENLNSLKIQLKETNGQLKEVVVTSTKPLIRQEDDKSVVDPEPLAAASTNAYETMEKIPGIFIDQDGNIYLNGLSPAGIQINGRELRMSASDMATLLKSLPPSSIQKIELEPFKQPSRGIIYLKRKNGEMNEVMANAEYYQLDVSEQSVVIESYKGVLKTDFPLSTLAHISAGYSAGSIKKTCEKVLTEYRVRHQD